ncbi:MAG TPA: EAL domain-containing protein [Acidimicrobiia bacterium]|nr:EAL domain-containing protein [Acidimicrobiia bacterium]
MERWQPGNEVGDEEHDGVALAAVSTSPSIADTVSDAVSDTVSDTALLDLLPHPAFAVAVDGDEDFRFIYTNESYRRLLDDPSSAGEPLSPAAATGDLRHVVPANALVAHVRAFARAAREHRPIAFEAEWGSAVPTRRVAVDVTPLIGADGVCEQLVGAAYDVSEHRRIEAELAHRTRHDPLTELPNRVMLVEWLQHALKTCADDARVGLVLVDIDHFKVVNDSLGLEAGDELLATTASRLSRVLRSGDRLARLGGDELAVVCHNVTQVDDVMTLARRLRAVFDLPFTLGDDEVFLGASVGVIVSDGADDTPTRLLRDADVAVFAAKELGRGRVELFDDAMRERAVRRLEIESGLRRALVRGEFRVHYQPVVAFARSEMIGIEALVRWEHPELGLLEPADFLEIAEETGLIVPIGAWVLHEACSQTARWCAELPHESPLSIAVNISARQLVDPELVSIVESVLAATRLDPSLLTLEINETVLVENREIATAVLEQLAARGVRIGIDDFGTGQSSLAHLNVLPLHTLKIDRSLIAGLGQRPENSAIVSAIVGLGHALDFTVTAEGIEDDMQLHTLRTLGCDLGQGYYFARPQPGQIVRALVHHRFRWSERISA